MMNITVLFSGLSGLQEVDRCDTKDYQRTIYTVGAWQPEWQPQPIKLSQAEYRSVA